MLMRERQESLHGLRDVIEATGPDKPILGRNRIGRALQPLALAVNCAVSLDREFRGARTVTTRKVAAEDEYASALCLLTWRSVVARWTEL
jgi:hypothetical protein